MQAGPFFILFSIFNSVLAQRSLTQQRYRLTKDVIPVLYDIRVKPYLQQEDGPKQFTFEGQVNITLHTTLNNVSDITLHKDRIDILNARLFDELGNAIQVIKQESMDYENVTDKLTLHLSSQLKAYKVYILHFKYQGEIRNGMEGFYRATYDNVNWYAMTQLHRIDARTVFPCFDEPEFKAKFRMHVSRPREYKSFFNTRLIKTTNEGTDRFVDHFEATPLMSTYLVAFVISDFEFYGSEDLQIIMHSKFNGKTKFAHEVGIKALEAYDNYTQIPYKTMGNAIMQKVGANHFPHNGMENWGLIIYKDKALALEPDISDGWLNKQYTVSLIVHEIGHMWFGNSVTHKWWSYFWLNEAFPNYYQYFLAQKLYPEYELDKQFLLKEMHSVFEIDATIKAQPMTSLEETINTPQEIGSKFSEFAYAKGASIVRMFSNLMGKGNFDLAIREYLKENHLNSVEPQNFFNILKKYWPSGHAIDLNEFFKDWTEQVGYPMVMVSVSPNGRFSIRQKRFLLDPNDGINANLRYIIPITFNNDKLKDFSNLQPKFYLTKDQDEIIFGNTEQYKWIIINTQQSNYFRVFYDDKLLTEIRKVLMANNHTGVHVNNRASIVDDLFTYGRIGLRGYDEVLAFMEYLATETEYSPWQAALKGFEVIYKRLTVAQHDKLKDFLYEIMAKVYQKLGFENPNVTILDTYNRNKVIDWLCKYHYKDCNLKAQKLFYKHLKANNKPLPDFRETLYCAANRYDNISIYESLRDMFIEQQFSSEKEKILRALGCTRHRIQKHYEFLLSDNVAKELKIIGLKSLYSQTPENVIPVFCLMIENIEQLANTLSSWSTTASIIADIADYLTTQEELDSLKEFIKTKGHLFNTYVTILENAIQNTENNLEWSANNIGKLMDYLSQRYTTYRLSKDVVPELYDIYIKPYLKQEDGVKQFTFDGEVNITVQVMAKNIKKITLHKDYIHIVKVILYDAQGNVLENINSGSLLYEPVTDKFTVYLTDPLELKTKYILYIKYQGQIRTGLAGVFRATYDEVIWYGITQLQRIDARTAFPCFDEPEFKAKFRMHISRPLEYKSFFNTRLMESIKGSDYYMDRFEETPLMSTYLVGFIISDYESYGNEEFKFLMHSDYKNKSNFAYEVGLKILVAYDKYTQLPYRSLGNEIMQKAGSPRFPHNGMENWGLVIYKDSVLAHEPGYTDGWSNKQYTLTILAHETSHMWFGNSVTFKWWSYFWLNEAFARYYQYFLAHELYPEYELDKQFVINQLQLIFATDATNNTQPLTSPEETINSPSDIGYKFSGITYAKGAAIIRMFANLMGKAKFDNAIREYLKDNQSKSVIPQDLFKYLKKYWPKEHQVDIEQFFKDWTEQEGYPLVMISTSPDGKYSLKQRRFLLDANDGSNAFLRYTIPITYNNDRMTDFNNLKPKFYFNKTQQEITFGNASHYTWIILNAQQSNYYRVYYDDFLLKQLSAAFMSYNYTGIHVSSRASVVDDLFTFGSVGLRGYDEVLEFMEYLSHETEYLPWYAAFMGISTLYKRLTLEEHKEFAPFLYELLKNVYIKLGFGNNNDTVLDIYNRNNIVSWLCRYHHGDCNRQAQQLFIKHVESNTKPKPDFRETLYCAAVRLDQNDIYEHLKGMFRNQELKTEKEKIIRAMGCSKFQVQKHYAYILSKEVTLDLKIMALNSLHSQTPENVMPVFDLMTSHVEQLAEALQDWSTTASVISSIAEYLTTQEQLNRLQEFTNEKGHLFNTSIKVLKNSIKSTENNLKWASKHLGKFFTYLKQRNAATSFSPALIKVPLLMLIIQMFL